jgi:CIC family chloride channel protein
MRIPFSKKVSALLHLAKDKLTKRQFIFLSSILIGLSAGLAAIVLKIIVHYIFLAATYDKLSDLRFLYLLLPMIGIFLTVVIVRKVLKNNFVKGLPQIHYAIAKKSSIIPRSRMYDQVLTSSVTVALGGSTGLEAPIVITGAAFGSNYARSYHLTKNERTLLLACGISAGIAAAFNAPIAGVLFALEVLLLDISIGAFTPLILAAATGALVSKVIVNEGILLSFKLQESFDYKNVPFYVLLGVMAGLVSVYHSRMFIGIESIFHRTKTGTYKKVVLGGLALVALIFIFPSLFGEGYQSIMQLSEKQPHLLFDNSILKSFSDNEWFVLFLIGALVFLKAVATGLTIGAGGNGGNFAPALFVGAYLGYFFSRLVQMLNITNLPENNFTIVGMAGILSGLYHAPLTSIFLIAEITGGYTLMIPLMIVSSISFAISKYFEPFSMDTKKIAAQGALLSNDRDQNVLSAIKTTDFIETDYPKLDPYDSLGTLVQVISCSTRNIFPVVDKENHLLGVVWLDNVRDLMFKTEQYETILVKDLMTVPVAVLFPTQTMQNVMKRFDQTGMWVLPVAEKGYFVGFISKSNIFTGYRSKLKVAKID